MSSDYLQVDIEHTLGDLSLRISCALSAPWTVLFGPSGAGKTSLLRVLGGLTRPERGRVVFTDRTLVETESGVWVPPAQRGIGFVTQRPTLFPHMDVTANVAFGLSGLSRRSSGERVGQMLRTLSRRPPRQAPSLPIFPEARSSGWRWPAPSLPSRACCCWTSHSLALMPI